MDNQLLKKFPFGTNGHIVINIADKIQISKSLKKAFFLKNFSFK
tara:strand:- start:50 stop:181 length:132 start_codon:yes stop_codon:yes gene_type:complete